MSSMRSVILMAVPTLAALFGGLFWFTRKKRSSNQLEFPKPPDKKPSKKSVTIKKSEGEPPREVPSAATIATTVEKVEASPANEVEASPANEVEASPANEVEASPVHEVEASPVHEVEASPVHEVEASPVHEVEASPVHEVEASPVHEIEASPANEVEASPANEVEASPVHEVEASLANEVEASPASEDVVPEEVVLVAAKQEKCAIPPKADEDGIDWAAVAMETSWVEEVESALCATQEQNVITNGDKDVCRSRSKRQDSGHMESPQSELSNGSSSHDSASDAQSELSSDSGKASSLDGGVLTSNTASANVASQEDLEEEEDVGLEEVAQIYEFDMPSHLCGMFIGRGGAAIKQLRQKTGVEVLVRPKMLTEEFQLVVLEGSQRQITRALDIIRQKFPKNKFTELDLSPAQPEVPVLQPQLMQLNLPDGVSSDVVVSSVVSPNHLFVQQPTHPSFPNLECMNQCMNVCYNQDDSVPPLPRPIEVGIICAAPMYNSWYRAQVVQAYPETDGVDIKYVDYGGYVHVEASTLRQIRSDFTTMPFQSTECYLANVVPPADCAEFAPESAACLEELVQGRLLQAEVVGHEEDGIPYINLYCSDDTRSFLLNRVLVDQGIAQWYEESA